MQSFYDFTQSSTIFEQRVTASNIIHICCYQNINMGVQNEAFRVFWFQQESDQLTFPTLLKTEILLQKIHSFSEELIGVSGMQFQGYLYFNQEMFVVYNVSELPKPKHLQIGTTWEIVNSQQIDNIRINQTISDFFISNSSLCFLHKKIKEEFHVHEIPIVCYSLVPDYMSEYILEMGPIYETFGQYHTFQLSFPTNVKTNQIIHKYIVVLKTHCCIHESVTPQKITELLKEYNSIICNDNVYIQSIRNCYFLTKF